ncbi:MAG: DUF3575 domain-containing protein [Saprospiraceae bacterium]
MKSKFLFLALAFVAIFSVRSTAQIDVTVNPIGLLFGDLSVGADFVLSDVFSVEGTIGYGGGKDDFTSLKWSNVPVTVVGKYYFNPDDGADKFYADAFLRFIGRSYKADGTTSYAEYSQTRLGIGVGIGYKAVSRGGVVFDIGFGVGRALVDNTKFEAEGDEFTVDWPDIMFQGKLGVGYRFGN